MRDFTLPQLCFICCIVIGLCLLSVHWFTGDAMVGFFLIQFMLCTTLLRWRFPKLGATVLLDIVVSLMFLPVTLALALFSAMYYRWYIAGIVPVIFLAIYMDMYTAAVVILAGLAGLFLGQWEKGREQWLKTRDTTAERFYELEELQGDFLAATARIERMTAVSERARIAREIHDNAGHEIVAAYMSLQTAREVMADANPDALALYDAALERLEVGANKIREAVHNLAPVTALGVEALQSTCDRFTAANVNLHVFGDTNHVPVHVWGVLEPFLNEVLTNAARHARPKTIKVNLDATPHIVRLYVENKVRTPSKYVMGNGLRNLRHRVASVGGSMVVDAGDVFRVVCVVPLRREKML